MTGRTVTYGIIVGEIQPQKYETHCTQLTVGGNLIIFSGDVELFQPKTSTFSTRALIWVHFKTVHCFSQPIISLFYI